MADFVDEPAVEQPAGAVMPFGGCTRCDDPTHASFDCPLIGVGAVIRARHATACCLHSCGEVFVTVGPLEQRFVGESLVRRTVATGLQPAQNRFWLCRWTDAQESEMINGQIQQQRCEETRILVSVWGFAHRSSAGP